MAVHRLSEINCANYFPLIALIWVDRILPICEYLRNLREHFNSVVRDGKLPSQDYCEQAGLHRQEQGGSRSCP